MNNTIDMIKAMTDYFEKEYRHTKFVLTHRRDVIGKPSDVVWYSIQRCLGVAEIFIDSRLVPANIAESAYEGIKEKLENLLKNPLTND